MVDCRDFLEYYHNSSLNRTRIIRLWHYAIVAAGVLLPEPVTVMPAVVAAAVVVAVAADVAAAFVAVANVAFVVLNCEHVAAIAADDVPSAVALSAVVGPH